MKWFHNLRTGAKLQLGFGLMILFLAATTAVANLDIAKIQRSLENLYERDFTIALEISETRTLLNRDRVNTLELLEVEAGPQQDRLRDDIKSESADLDARLQVVTELAAGDHDLLRRLAEVKTALAEYRQHRDAELALVAQGKVEEARTNDASGMIEDYEKVRDMTIAISKEAKARAAADVVLSEQEAKQSSVIFIFIAGVALLCAFSLVILLNAAISRPLVRISGMAEKIAAGDLTVDVPDSGRTDEVGAMQATFGKMVAGLRDITRQIREAVNVLASSATEIMASTAQLASGAAETASAVAETTTTLEEVKQTSQISSQKARAVSDEARKAAEVAATGKQSVEQTIAGMDGIQRQMSSIAESIINLSSQSQAIGDIITSVDDLAAQSKLLAVNASIEAAKAGEEGKGFGVVAQEVKSLAEQSRQATAQVRTILSDIQKATSSAVLATEQGGKAVEAGVAQSARSGESISALTENIAQAAQAATQIAATSQQQFVGVDQVALAMENIKTASTQTVASTRQAEVAAQQLHDLGQTLKHLIDRFKV